MVRSMHRRGFRLDPQPVAARLRRACSVRPRLGIVLGSGFRHALPELRVAAELPFAAIPGFPTPAVSGHAGQLLLGHLGELPVAVLSGRAHYYEGWPMAAVTFPVAVLAALGITDLLLTNAAGGISGRLRAGDFMCVRDHINLLPENPLRGLAAAARREGGPADCFLDLTQVYDPRLAGLLRAAARKAKVRLREGVYLAVSGPCYETPAEIRAFGRWGADAVGMSTVPEAIVARHWGVAVAGLSCITNLAAGRGKRPLSHAEVLAAGERAQAPAGALLGAFVQLYTQGISGTSRVRA